MYTCLQEEKNVLALISCHTLKLCMRTIPFSRQEYIANYVLALCEMKVAI